jgi:hypothetical protein
VFPGMTGQGQACQEGRPGAGEAPAGPAWFRREFYSCLWRRGDAPAEPADAVLTAPGPVASLPYLSPEPAFRRGHGMICQGLAEGRVDAEALRDLLVAARPRDWPPVFAVDASAYRRPAAQASPGREWHPHSCAGHHGRRRRRSRGPDADGGRDGDAVVAGWAFQWLAQLSFEGGSWTAPQDMTRAGVRDDATAKAARMIIAHAARLRGRGEPHPAVRARRRLRRGAADPGAARAPR